MTGLYDSAGGQFSMNTYLGINNPGNPQRYLYWDIPSGGTSTDIFLFEIWQAGWSYGRVCGYRKDILSNNIGVVSARNIITENTIAFAAEPRISNVIGGTGPSVRVGIDNSGGTANVMYVRITGPKNFMLNIIDNSMYYTTASPF
jgi:hypothetical protein